MSELGESCPFSAGLGAAVSPLDIRPETDALEAVADVVASAGVVLLGETHGVVENAGVLDWFVRRFGPAQVGLEWRASAVDVLSDFYDGRSVDVARLRPSADGRITPQHFCAVRDLLHAGLLTGVAGFAPDNFEVPADDPSQNSWERALAGQLLARRDRSGPMIVMAGCVHTLVEPQPVRGDNATPVGRSFAGDPRFDNRDLFYPMGWHLAQAALTVAVRIRYGRGSFTNFTRRVFAADRTITGNRFRWRDGELTVEVLDATAAVVPDHAG